MASNSGHFSLQSVQQIADCLKSGGIDNFLQEAKWMLEEANQRHLPDEILQQWCRRRIAGEPFQYILGNTDFFNLTLEVGPGVLIPRPETEQLVEIVINATSKLPMRPSPIICDVCTGSGAIALSLGKAIPHAQILATDISGEALFWANKNLSSSKLRNVSIFQGNLLDPICQFLKNKQRSIDIIVSNPPYVTENEYSELEPVVKNYEPKLALTAGDDGLDIIRPLVEQSAKYLKPGGNLFMEIGCTQGEKTLQLINDFPQFVTSNVIKDFSGRDRFVSATTAY